MLRHDGGALPTAKLTVHGAHAAAKRARTFVTHSRIVRPALVNGTIGVVVTVDGRPVSVMGITITDGKIVAIDALSDPQRLTDLDITDLGDEEL